MEYTDARSLNRQLATIGDELVKINDFLNEFIQIERQLLQIVSKRYEVLDVQQGTKGKTMSVQARNKA